MISSDLTEKARVKLCNLLQRSLDIFAWTPADMTGVLRHIAEHRLNVREGCQPVRRKKRGQAAERNIAINDEVSKLVAAGIMREVHYHDWLSNPVMVKKSYNSWRMCVDFKDLNKACPKDGYPLPEIDWKVDAVLSLQSPKCLKDVQKLNGKLASLNRFLAKSVEKSLPFFKTLKKCTKKSVFLWIEEAEVHFRDEETTCKVPCLTLRRTRGTHVYLEASRKRLTLPRVSVKGQVQANFIVERPEEEGQDDSAKEEEPLLAQWTLFTDGSSCVDRCGAGVILTDPEGVEFTYALRFHLQVNVDSKHVANQVNGTYIAKETDIIKYLEKVKKLVSTFRAFSIKQVPRSKNKKEDALSKIASTSFAHLSKQVLVEELKEKSVNESEVLVVVDKEGDSWMTPIHEYLTDETLPAKRKKERAIKRKSQRFAIINRILYKKSFLGPWLRCVRPSQANYVLREIHEGSCSMHAGTRSIVAKALRIGYYWPTMHKDARALIKACQ
ncbi:reverse transcriptase domain-containing protein [Tanacetum coccineum]